MKSHRIVASGQLTRSTEEWEMSRYSPRAPFSSAGCSLEEALLDGFFVGISDTIATIISNVFLGSNG